MLVLGGVGAALASVVVPSIEAAKEREAEREATTAGVRASVERRRVLEEQRPRRGRGQRPAPPGDLAPWAERRARVGLLRDVEVAITEDARGRARAGTLKGEVVRTACEPYPRTKARKPPETDLGRTTGAYDCLAITREIRRPGSDDGVEHPSGALGYPFRAIVDFRRFTYVWCKINPVPGEAGIPALERVVGLPKPCRRRA